MKNYSFDLEKLPHEDLSLEIPNVKKIKHYALIGQNLTSNSHLHTKIKGRIFNFDLIMH